MKKQQKIVAEEIISIVNKYFETECREKTRAVRVSRPRMYAQLLIREYLNLSYTDIGLLFDLGHDSVLYGVKRARYDLKTDKKRKGYYNELITLVMSSKVYLSSTFARSAVISNISAEINHILLQEETEGLLLILKKLKDESKR